MYLPNNTKQVDRCYTLSVAWSWLEGSFKSGSIPLSFNLFFLELTQIFSVSLQRGCGMGHKQGFFIHWKNWLLIFLEFGLYIKFILFSIFLHKSYIWKKSGSRAMVQNALDQSNYSIFKSIMSLEQNYEIGLFLCVLIQIHEN